MRVRPTGPIVPSSNIQGNALIVVIAIMAFLACLTLGAVSMVRSTAASWESQISREITIQIKPDDNLDMDKALARRPRHRAQFRRHQKRPDRRRGGDGSPARTLARRRPRPQGAARSAPGDRHHRRRIPPISTRCATSSRIRFRRQVWMTTAPGSIGSSRWRIPPFSSAPASCCWSLPPWC